MQRKIFNAKRQRGKEAKQKNLQQRGREAEKNL
jgi:hypothetical protein